MGGTLSVFKARNNQGQKLLDDFIRPICARSGAELREAPANAHRGNALWEQMLSTITLWDCSVEEGHVYNAFNNWAKSTRNHVVVSRTPLPRNVMTYHQCAPGNGNTMTNEEIGAWLDRQLPMILGGGGTVEPSGMSGLAHHYWLYDRPADYFLSFRETQRRDAELWVSRFEARTGKSVRMVPVSEYSYPAECVTQQQRWEGVARLLREMRATKRVLIFWSDDYLDSFWTSSELFATFWLCYAERGGLDVQKTGFIRDQRDARVQPFAEAVHELGIPVATGPELDRLAKLINNCDPVTSAPEARIPPRGAAKFTRWLLKDRFGYYDAEFTTDRFWDVVWVPCQRCAPQGRTPARVSWGAHMTLTVPEKETDYFGYFAVTRSALQSGTVRCPACGEQSDLEGRRGDRTLWSPIMTTEIDKRRDVILKHKIWEAVGRRSTAAPVDGQGRGEG